MQRLPASMLDAIDRFGQAVRADPPLALLAAAPAPVPFFSELDSLQSLPVAAVRRHLVSNLRREAAERGGPGPAADGSKLAEGSPSRPRSNHPEPEPAIEQADVFIARFAELLHRYFEQAFGTEWKRIEPLLAATAGEATRRIADDGLFETLEHLSPRLRGDRRARRILVDHVVEADVTLGRTDLLVLAPSIYAWPDVTVLVEQGPWPRRVVYPAPLLAAWSAEPPPPAQLQELLRALGNHTRLSALRLIAEKPRTTQDLAPLLGISEATLSRHLRLLTEVGALSRHRDGKFVRYALESHRLTQLEPGLLRYLHGSPGDTK